MTDRSRSAFSRTSSYISSSSPTPTSELPTASSSVRPRNRRLLASAENHDETHSNRTSGLLSTFSPSASRAASPLPPASRSAGVSPSRGVATGDIGQFLADSWTQSWSSVQGLTSSLFSGTSPAESGLLNTGSSGHRQDHRGRRLSIGGARKAAASWGPAPPSQTPGVNDVAAGSLAQRQAALKAARTASVLESHDGVNGGLDISGKHKRRNSDEVIAERNPDDDYLAYIHHVRPNDTYAGLILRYKCREDAFRRANGLWSRDSIQTRKWITIPVDACDVRGRPCDPPSWHNSQKVDHLAPTPNAEDESSTPSTLRDDFFSKPAHSSTAQPLQDEEETPWTHVRWVKMDANQDPVEIGRIARGTMGYFPPRRRRSIRTISSLSTPRQSFDLPRAAPGSTDGLSPGRPSSLSSRPQFSGTPTSNRSRMGSDPADARPAWMKRPGGVGSMGRNVRTPGPDKDVFNTWTKKHIPGLNIDGPSMSIMGSETANFGFKQDSSLVESSYENGRDVNTLNRQGNGLDRAAAAVETWLRGALAKGPVVPLKGSDALGDLTSRDGTGDLIELTDTASDDGRGLGSQPTNIADSLSLGTSGRNDAVSGVRGRSTFGGVKGGKAD